MESVPAALNRTIDSLGTVFGSISSNLDDLDKKTKSLRHDCNVLLQSAGGQDDSNDLLFRVAETLEGPTNFLGNCISEQTEHRKMMNDCETIAADLLKKQKEMVATLEPLKFMLVFFKIEASELPEADRQTFHSVSEEISHLHVLVDETFQRNIKNLAEARNKIQRAQKTAKKARDHQANLIQVKQNEINQAISTLKTQVHENSQKTTDLDNAAEKFESATNLLVMSLQYEDIIRQRCEHILEKLHQKPDHIRNGAWLLYQAKQIETAAEEIRQSTAEIQSGLQNIEQQAKQLYQASTTMDQFEHITVSADGMVQTLLESLESIHQMLKQSTGLSQNACQAITPVQDLTKELSAIVFEVSIKIQFIALNAQVRSIQVGEGSGLEVLAARTAEISTLLRNLGDETADRIQSLHTKLEALVSTSQEECEEGQKQLRIIDENGPDLERKLHQLRDSTFDSLQIVGKLTSQVESFTQTDLQKLQALNQLASLLEQKARDLREEAKFNSLSKREKERIESELHSLLNEKKDAMHNRLHDKSADTRARFNLQISENSQTRSDLATAIDSDNVEFF